MQVGSAYSASQAMGQVSRSVEQINELTQGIVDATQNLDNKMVRASAEAKVQSASAEQKLDLLA